MPDQNESFRVTANEFVFSLTRDRLNAADILKRSPVDFHLLKDHRSVQATVIASDSVAKKLTIEVEGESFHITIKDDLDQVIEKLGFNESSNKQIREIKAPMPGLVLEISVSEGQELKEGERILILEAMKMENSIVIHTGATIKKILVNKGQAVEKGQVLVELE